MQACRATCTSLVSWWRCGQARRRAPCSSSVRRCPPDCREARQAKEAAQALLNDKSKGGAAAQDVTASGRRSTLDVGSSLQFTPITVCWRDLSYYVTVPKGLTGAAALNVMPADAGEELAGKKRLLNSVTGARQAPFISCGRPYLSHNMKGVLCMCTCLLYTSPSPRDRTRSRMPSSA